MSFIMCRKLSIGHFNCFAIKCHFSLVTTMQLNKLMHYHYYTCNSLQITTSNITNGNLFVTLEKVASLIQIFSSIVPWLFRVLIKCWWQSGGRSGHWTGHWQYWPRLEFLNLYINNTLIFIDEYFQVISTLNLYTWPQNFTDFQVRHNYMKHLLNIDSSILHKFLKCETAGASCSLYSVRM